MAPVFTAVKDLTIGHIMQMGDASIGDVSGIIEKKDLTTPVTIKGYRAGQNVICVSRRWSLNGGPATTAPSVRLRLGTEDTVPPGIKAVTGPALYEEDFTFLAGAGDAVYHAIPVGKDLFTGGLVE